MKTYTSLFLLVSSLLFLSACAKPDNSQLPNPASVYCENSGGTLEIKDGTDGQYGICHFPDGSSCEEWAYYRGECSKGNSTNKN